MTAELRHFRCAVLVSSQHLVGGVEDDERISSGGGATADKALGKLVERHYASAQVPEGNHVGVGLRCAHGLVNVEETVDARISVNLEVAVEDASGTAFVPEPLRAFRDGNRKLDEEMIFPKCPDRTFPLLCV